jgi:DNA-binding transcriptional MerR regulator/effector-binding domain-containing protein
LKNNYYSIGEVCKICHISSSSLRYYDRAGIIRADHINAETGYRYYSEEVLLKIPILYFLQQQGFSLKEIGEILYRDNLVLLREALEKKRAELAERIRRNELRKNTVSSWIELLRERDRVFSLPECPVSCQYFERLDVIPVKPSDFPGRSFRNLLVNTSTITDFPDDEINTIGALYLYYPRGDLEDLSTLQLFIKTQNSHLDRISLGGFSAVSCYHRGSFDRIPETVAKMRGWAEEHRFRLRGDLLERSVVDCWSTSEEDQWLMSLYMPVTEEP